MRFGTLRCGTNGCTMRSHSDHTVKARVPLPLNEDDDSEMRLGSSRHRSDSGTFRLCSDAQVGRQERGPAAAAASESTARNSKAWNIAEIDDPSNVAGEAAVMPNELPTAVAAATTTPPTSLRNWLQSIDREWAIEGRMERYTDAFEREFPSVDIVKLTAVQDGYGIGGIFEVCDVKAYGDRALLENAISGLSYRGADC